MMRTGIELTAFGRVVSGSSVSATVVPTISMPMKAKSAIWKPPRKPVNPLGKKPPWLHRFETAAAVPLLVDRAHGDHTETDDDQGDDRD